MKTCTGCGLGKDESEFYFKSKSSGVLRGNCKVCHLAKTKRNHRRAYRAWNDVKRDRVLREKYGLSIEKKAAMAERQKGACAICREAKPLVVDHSHATKKVRGLLCQSCNLGLGKFGDCPARLRRAAAYLRKSNSALLVQQ